MTAGIVRVLPVEEERVVASLLRQLAARHGVDARYVGRRAARGRTVLEFRATSVGGAPLHVVVDGSGPGRASWVVGAGSAEQAVEASEWIASARAAAGEGSPEPQALDRASRGLPPQ